MAVMVEKYLLIIGLRETQKSLIPIIYVHGFKGFKDWGASNLVADSFANQGFFIFKI